MLDIQGKPMVDQTVTATSKLWWPHTEALIATTLALVKTEDHARWLPWLERVHGYCVEHFVCVEHGEWYGYCDRDGNLSSSAKGGNYKGMFHTPRALLMCIQYAEGACKELAPRVESYTHDTIVPAAPGSVHNTIVALTQKLLESITSLDWPTYQELCVRDMTAFEPEAKKHLVKGLAFHKHYFDYFAGKPSEPVTTTVSSPDVRVVGDVAVIAYVRLAQRGLDTTCTPETRVWQRVHGRWKHVHFHRS